jgi:predicted nucleic acid-binding protein
VGLDTSVVMRLLRGEPRAQMERALRFLDELLAQGHRAVVSDLVVAETYFALHTHYGVPKNEAVRTLAKFLRSGLVAPEPGESALEALDAALASSQKPGFADRLIHAQYMKTAGRMASFEKAAAKLEGSVVLKA